MIKSIQIQLTSKCNQKCVMCRKYTWAKKELPLLKVIQILEKYKGATVTFSGGDPLEYSRLPGLVHYLARNEIVYQVLTNLTYVLDFYQTAFLKKAKWIQVSLDGSNTENYQKIRGPGADFMTMIENLKYFDGIKFNCTVSRMNSSDIRNIALLACQLNSPVRFWPVHTHDNMRLRCKDLHYINCQIHDLKSHYKFVFDNTNLKDFEEIYYRKPSNMCYVKTHHRVIDEDGREYPCCRAINDNGSDVDGKYKIENLEGLECPNLLYDFCDGCDRYVKFNNDWCSFMNKEELFL